MKVYKLVISIIDLEEHGETLLVEDIKNLRGFSPSIISIESAEIGEWTDDHPLNNSNTYNKEIERLFNAKKTLSNT